MTALRFLGFFGEPMSVSELKMLPEDAYLNPAILIEVTVGAALLLAILLLLEP